MSQDFGPCPKCGKPRNYRSRRLCSDCDWKVASKNPWLLDTLCTLLGLAFFGLIREYKGPNFGVLLLALPFVVGGIVVVLYVEPLVKIVGTDWLLILLVVGVVWWFVRFHFHWVTVVGMVIVARVLNHIGNWIEKRREGFNG